MVLVSLDGHELLGLVAGETGLPLEVLRLMVGGREVFSSSVVLIDSESLHLTSVDVRIRGVGGKGGFGANLRAMKKKKSTTNFAAMRTLDGRRQRIVEIEQQMKEFLNNGTRMADLQAEKALAKMSNKARRSLLRHKQREAQKAELERQAKLKEEQEKQASFDASIAAFDNSVEAMEKRIRDATIAGVLAAARLAAAQNAKAKAERRAIKAAAKKSSFMMVLPGDDDDDDDDDDDGAEEDGDNGDGQGDDDDDDDDDDDGDSESDDDYDEYEDDRSGGENEENGREEGRQSKHIKGEEKGDGDDDGQQEGQRTRGRRLTQRDKAGGEEEEEAPSVSTTTTSSSSALPHTMSSKRKRESQGSAEAVTDSKGKGGVEEGDESECEGTDTKRPRSSEPGVPAVPAAVFSSAVVAPVQFETFSSVSELEALGLETLKVTLQSRGVKCGGTLKERAERAFSIRGLTRDQIPKKLLA